MSAVQIFWSQNESLLLVAHSNSDYTVLEWSLALVKVRTVKLHCSTLQISIRVCELHTNMLLYGKINIAMISSIGQDRTGVLRC